MKRNRPRIIAIGDNVCDKIISRNKMYPGGQCVNTCVYAKMNGAESAYLGKFGNDEIAECVKSALDKFEIDYGFSRNFEGENGFACVTIEEGERVFIGSNKGGVAKDNPYNFKKTDYDYIKEFDLIYTDLNCYIEQDLPVLAELGIPIAFDFSNRWNEDYLKEICPYLKIAILSCAHLDKSTREKEMKKVSSYGVKIVLGTMGEEGSFLLYKDKFYYTEAKQAQSIQDTMGAGDSFFAAFLCHLLKKMLDESILWDDEEKLLLVLKKAMEAGANFASEVVGMEGAFGHGEPIVGRIIDNGVK